MNPGLDHSPDDLARVSFADQFRRLGHLLRAGEHDVDEIRLMAARLGAEADRLEGAPPRSRTVSGFADKLQRVMPADGELFPNDLDRPVSGHGNPFAVPLTVRRVGVRAVTDVVIEAGFEGAPGMCHGGYVAAIYDDLLGFLLMLQQTIAFTASLTVNYHEGTPMAAPLHFEAWVDRVEGKKLFLAAECHSEDRLLTSCTALFIDVRERFEQAAESAPQPEG